MNSKLRFDRLLLLPFIPVLLGVLMVVADTGLHNTLRNALFDQYQRWHPRTYVDVPVRVVDIDEESLERLGQWPWPRTRIAELVEKLDADGAAVVAFDVLFAEADRTSPQVAAELWGLSGTLRSAVETLPDHDDVLAETLAQSESVIGFVLEPDAPGSEGEIELPVQKGRFIEAGELQNHLLHRFGSAITSLPQLERAASGNGAISFVPDSDGVVRRVPLLFTVGATPVATLVGEALRVGQGEKNVVLKSAGQESGLQGIKIGNFAIPTTPEGEVWVHYTEPAPSRYLPAWKVLAAQAPSELIEGSFVLVGSSAQGLMDLRFSPLGLMPGVEAHAQALEQVLTRHFLERPGWAIGAEAVILMVAGLLIGFIALRANALPAAAVCAVLLVAIFGGGWYAFVEQRLLLDSATPAMGTLLSFLICSLAHHISSERQERWVKEAFSRYVSPNRVEHILEHPEHMELGGRRQESSFVFTDLANFTSLMERIDPGKAVALLNSYLDEMIAIAFRHEGTLDRIVGDAVAIMFSAPVPQADHKRRALACALEMDRYASRYSRELQAGGIPFGETRIGVHGGEVIVGNFGGSNIFDYRALGDPVNAAARIESVNKHLGTRICISEFIVADSPEAVVRPVGRLVLKGKSSALRLYEPVVEGDGGRAPVADYAAAFDLLQAEDNTAAARFAALAEEWPEDPLVAFHNRRLAAGESGDRVVMGEK